MVDTKTELVVTNKELGNDLNGNGGEGHDNPESKQSANKLRKLFRNILAAGVMLTGVGVGPAAARTISTLAELAPLVDGLNGTDRGETYEAGMAAFNAHWPPQTAKFLTFIADRIVDGEPLGEIPVYKLVLAGWGVDQSYSDNYEQIEFLDKVGVFKNASASELEQITVDFENRYSSSRQTPDASNLELLHITKNHLDKVHYFGVHDAELREGLEDKLGDVLKFNDIDSEIISESLSVFAERLQDENFPEEWVEQIFFEGKMLNGYIALTKYRRDVDTNKSDDIRKANQQILNNLSQDIEENWGILRSYLVLFGSRDPRLVFRGLSYLDGHQARFPSENDQVEDNINYVEEIESRLGREIDLQDIWIIHEIESIFANERNNSTHWQENVSDVVRYLQFYRLFETGINTHPKLVNLVIDSQLPVETLHSLVEVYAENGLDIDYEEKLDFSEDQIESVEKWMDEFPVLRQEGSILLLRSLIRNDNFQISPTSSSWFVLGLDDAIEFTRSFLAKNGDKFESPTQAAEFLAVSFQAVRHRGLSVESHDEIQEKINILAEVVAPYLDRVIQMPVTDSVKLKLICDLMGPYLETNTIASVLEIKSIWDPRFEVLQGETFNGVFAELKLDSLEISKGPVGDATKLKEGQIAMPLLWSYFLNNDDNVSGLIELAITRDSEGVPQLLNNSSLESLLGNVLDKWYMSLGEDGGISVGKVTDLIGNDNNLSDISLDRILGQNKFLFVPNFFYNKHEKDELIGYGDARLSQFTNSFLVVGHNNEGRQVTYYLQVKSVSHNKTAKPAFSDYMADQEEVFSSISEKLDGLGVSIDQIIVGDPGHSVVFKPFGERPNQSLSAQNENQSYRVLGIVDFDK